MVSRCGQLFFVISRSSWMVFIFYGGYAHVFIGHMAGENRGQCLDKCMGGVGRTRVGGHDTRPKLKRNVDFT